MREATLFALTLAVAACSGSPRPPGAPGFPAPSPAPALSPSNGCAGRAIALAWSPAGELALGCGAEVHRLDPALRERSAFALPPGPEAIDLAFSPRGDRLAVARAGGAAVIVHPETGALLREEHEPSLRRGEGPVLSFSPDGARLAVILDEGIALHDLEHSTRTLLPQAHAESLAWSPDSTRLALGIPGKAPGEHAIAVWELGTASPAWVSADEDRPSSLRFSGDGRSLHSTSIRDEAWIVRSTATGDVIQSTSLPLQHPPPPTLHDPPGVLWNPPDAVALLPGEVGLVRRPEAGSGLERVDFNAPAAPRWSDRTTAIHGRLALSPRGDLLAAACDAGSICAWDLASGERRRARSPIAAHTAPIDRLLRPATGDWLLSSATDEAIRVWSLGEGTLRSDLHAMPHAAAGLVFGAMHLVDRGPAVAIASDGAWSFIPGDHRPPDRDPSSPLLAAGPRWLATATGDGSIEIRARAGAPLAITLRSIAGADAGYVFTPDGRFDLAGKEPDLARSCLGCSAGGVPVPLDRCRALRTPGLLASVLASLAQQP